MTFQPPLVIGIVAGESSGDILGANLMRSLKQAHAHVRFVGVGGPLMAAEGLDSLFPLETLSVMGLVDVLKQLPQLLSARKQVVNTMLTEQPHAFVGIDAPDFNLPIEKKLKAAGIKTIQYVSPSVWAWRPKRIFAIKKATHDVLSILPFEQDFYAQYDAPCTFVGHPLADDIPMQSDSEAARAALSLTADKQYVAVLPGSRGGEAGMLTRDFLDAAHLLHKRFPDLEFLLAFANPARREQILGLFNEQDQQLPFHFFDGQSRTVMTAADSCMLASGTVSLEAMLLKRPMVVCYKFAWLNYHILKHFVHLEHFSLPNLLAGKPVVKELLQDEVTPAAIAEEVQRHLQTDMSDTVATYQQLHASIRCDAGKRSAQRVLELALG
ncbi:lipid-A-disaccharide synthase [Aliidiomarina taiwanensis]|uniref:Lipid-A-disaccharide synthase n=1 Tax=Aliidiomarina taiwanensis TaxID=946228 RepID=A0A432XAD5_9GAMM|nr:lipid-A-disaccharide synthase [Aliidiomarina taiwanensis]RUO44347.1 lipid-A-disaccharide synthase [Aliidiomarina taiwanensis]